jgi:mannose-6-phosphate isomerase-like protein (cupin superfamily)
MKVRKKADAEPIVTSSGEIIYELVGRRVGQITERHSGAHVVIPPGKSSRLHYHPEAEESYFILKGRGRLRIGGEESEVSAGQMILIPPPQPHKIINTASEDLELLAICVPAWEPSNTVWLED